MKDALGDRMKMYESMAASRLMPGLPAMARLDGRNFHAFTLNARRPFCRELHGYMVSLTRALVEASAATIGYTQSDEITLSWLEHPFFDGNVQKMTSTLAAIASSRFNLDSPHDPSDGLAWNLPGRGAPTFDCRAWSVPSLAEASNVFLWRQQDATRNSVQMAARYYFAHKEVVNLDCKQLQEKLFKEKGVNWNDYPAAFKRGTFVLRAETYRRFTSEEIAGLPERHTARSNPNEAVVRRQIYDACLDLKGMDSFSRATALFTTKVLP